MSHNKFCYDDCKHLSPTEFEQTEMHRKTGNRFKHVCSKHGEVSHMVHCHPKIARHQDCDYMNEDDLNGFNVFLLNIINTIERQYNPESTGLREELKRRYFENKPGENQWLVI